MIFTDFLAVISFVLQCVIGLYYFFQDRKYSCHRYFLYMCLTLAIVSISNSSLRFGGITADDTFWNSMMYFGITCYGSFTLLFFLHFTRYYRHIRHPLLFKISLWLIPAFLIFIELFFQAVQNDFAEGFWYLFLHGYFYACVISSMIIVSVWTRRTSLQREKKQGRFLIYGGIINLILAIVSYYIMVKNDLPSITPVYYFLWGLIMFIAVQKFRFMGITPELFSRHILERIADYVVVFDSAGKIIVINKSFSTSFSLYKGDSVRALTGPIPEFMKRLKTRCQGLDNSEIEQLILHPENSNGLLPIRGRFTVLRDEFSDVLGILFTGHQDRDMLYVREQYSLTDRELETATHIASGLSNRDIADKMGVTANTVKTHVTNLYGKLSITNKIELINLIQSFGQEVNN